MKKTIERSDILFKEPPYAVLGGFHYPVEPGRNMQLEKIIYNDLRRKQRG